METETKTPQRESFQVKGTETFWASDLGFKAGVWPKTLTRAGKVFHRLQPIGTNGDLVGVIYRAVDGTEVMIYND